MITFLIWFFIVGSGSAGSVLGSRLSEIKDWKVLVLESGDTPPPESYVPGLDILLMQSHCDWGFYTTPQKYSQMAYKNRVGKINLIEINVLY